VAACGRAQEVRSDEPAAERAQLADQLPDLVAAWAATERLRTG
jgi:hypothetical protein